MNKQVRAALKLSERHESQFSAEFVQGMAARMAMSFEKYGDYRDAYPHKVDALKSLQLRIQKYHETHNTEHLMDAANFLLIEFMASRYADAQFTATDSDGSPGRVWQSGHVGENANTLGQENLRLGGSHRTTAGGFYKNEGD